MITVKNIRWPYKEFNDINKLMNILKKKVSTLSLQVNLVPEEKGFMFTEIDGMDFKSAKENKILMKKDDPRVTKLGRDYLLSNRPTKKQHDEFYVTLNKLFDDLGLFADIKQVVVKTGRTFTLREGKDVCNVYPQAKSYPVE